MKDAYLPENDEFSPQFITISRPKSECECVCYPNDSSQTLSFLTAGMLMVFVGIVGIILSALKRDKRNFYEWWRLPFFIKFMILFLLCTGFGWALVGMLWGLGVL